MPVRDDTLPANTYEAKKFLSDMGLGYEKIPACRNDDMLFWKDNQESESVENLSGRMKFIWMRMVNPYRRERNVR